MSEQHAFLAPSSAAIWVKCAAYPLMSQLYPETEPKQSALDGTAAHWGGSLLIGGQLIDVGLVAPNGVTLTEEMIEAAELYADDFSKTYAASGDVVRAKVESPVAIPYVHAHNNGTPDSWIFGHNPTRGRATLTVWDFKFGHEYVDAFENWQLVDYTCGILDELGIDGHADQHIDVVLKVVQPRNYHPDGPVRSWRVLASDLRPYFNKLKMAAERTFEAVPLATPNPGCKHCPGRHTCAALQREGYGAVDLAYRSLPVELPPQALGTEWAILTRAAKMLEARITGIEETITGHVKRGVSVPGCGIEHGSGRRVWNKPVPEVLALGTMFEKNLAKLDAITPAQAIKLGIDESVVNAYSIKPPGAAKLVPVTSTKARKVFSNG